jgi:hypothetical protein
MADMTKAACWLVFNSRSGSYREELIGAIREALAQGGLALAGETDCAAADPPAAADLRTADIGTLVVFGGDGTINSAARRAEGWDGNLLPLPGGTANLLCRDLFGDRDLAAILAALTAGELRERDHWTVSFAQGTALIEIVAGPGALWADAREELRQFDLLRALAKGIEAAGEGVSGARVKLIEPEQQATKPLVALRIVPQQGELVLYGYGAADFADFARHGLAVLTRSFREGNYEELASLSEFTCGTEDGSPLALMVDGERIDAGPQVRFRAQLLALRLLGLDHD